VPTIFDELLAAFRAVWDRVDDPLVRDAVGGVDWEMPERPLTPHARPALRYLDRLAISAMPAARPLAELLAGNRNRFRWGQTYTATDFGQGFIDNYGWLEVFGTRGHFVNEKLAAGVLLLGPHIVYPDHHHIAEEFYIPLTGGTEWRMGDRAFRPRAAGEVVHHASNVSHAMRTGDEPLLAAYLWRGGPLDQKSVVAARDGN